MSLPVLRLSATWERTLMPLQAWISKVVAAVNTPAPVLVMDVPYMAGVSPSPFPIAPAVRPRAILLGQCVATLAPSVPVVPTSFTWANTESGTQITLAGLTTGTAYTLTLCVVG